MTRKDVLDEAEKCVLGNREQDYGSPEDNFKTIAEFWSTYTGTKITAVDVAAMLSLLKLARIKSGHSKWDNWVDLAGYAACGGELQFPHHMKIDAMPQSVSIGHAYMTPVEMEVKDE